MNPFDETPLLTLEPLVEAVRQGLEAAGWILSGLQKTTSHQFEGRWEGESTRSAYLFFHRETDDEDAVSVDVYLDETEQGLQGNLALVVDLVPIGVLGDATEVLRAMGPLAQACLPRGFATPVTLRLRLDQADSDAASAAVEVRFKIRLPGRMIGEGGDAVSRFSTTVADGFDRILASEELRRLRQQD